MEGQKIEVIEIKGRKERVMLKDGGRLVTLALSSGAVEENYYETRSDGSLNFTVAYSMKKGYVDSPDKAGLGACGGLKPSTVGSYDEGIKLLREAGLVA